MTTYVAKIGTFESDSWTGENTEQFKTWVEQYLPTVPVGFTRAWDVIDNADDPENIVVDGILRVQVPGQTSSIYRTHFVRDEIAMAGPLFNGQPSAYGVTSINLMPPARLAEQYEEV
jgi:hypothetical protein